MLYFILLFFSSFLTPALSFADQLYVEPYLDNPFVKPQSSLQIRYNHSDFYRPASSRRVNASSASALRRSFDIPTVSAYEREISYVSQPPYGTNIGFSILLENTRDSLSGIGFAVFNRSYYTPWGSNSSFIKPSLFLRGEVGLMTSFCPNGSHWFTQSSQARQLYLSQAAIVSVPIGLHLGAELYFSKWIGLGASYGLVLEPGIARLRSITQGGSPSEYNDLSTGFNTSVLHLVHSQTIRIYIKTTLI